MSWVDLDARVRGMGGRLLGRAALEHLSAAGEPSLLARALRDTDYGRVPMPERPAAADLDLAVRRLAGERMRLLARWAGPRADALAVVFEDEDRRSIRALLRGAVAGAAPEDRLAGLIPTPRLPERALEEMARLPTTGDIAAALLVMGSPYGGALLRDARSAQPDLPRLERALSRTFAARARSLARGAASALGEHVRRVIDAENIAAALAIAAATRDASAAPDVDWIPGGRLVDRETFVAAATATDVLEAGRVLAGATGRSPLRRATRPPGERHGSVEDALLRAMIAEQRRQARLEPLGPAPVLLYALRLRAEVLDLRRILWGAALGVPSARLVEEMVSV